MALNWSFEKKESDDRQGWDVAEISKFRTNKVKSLVREILQNSLDNPVLGPEGEQNDPVRIKFKTYKKKLLEIPGMAELRNRITQCGLLKNESPSSIEEIKTAITVANGDEVPILEISDYGATGMEGPSTEGKTFYNYIKSFGASPGDTKRAGSHGHGKFAPLALSDLRTIFVSSVCAVDEEKEFVFQGRTNLATHKYQGHNYNNIGYLGVGFSSTKTIDNDFKWLKRDLNLETGTSLFVLGAQTIENFSDLIVGHAISSFFAAFGRRRLVIEVHSNEKLIHKVDHQNYASFFENQKIYKAMKNDNKGSIEDLTKAKVFNDVIFDEESILVEKQDTPLPGHGKYKLKVLDGDEYCTNQFAILRQNMLITSNLSTFYRRKQASLKSFNGVYECISKNGNFMIRGMEPSQHDDLSPDLLPHGDKQKQGTRLLKQLGAAMKDVVSKHAKIDYDEKGGQLDWLKEFFNDEDGDGKQLDELEEVNPEGYFVFTPKPRILKKKIPKPILNLDDELEFMVGPETSSRPQRDSQDSQESQKRRPPGQQLKKLRSATGRLKHARFIKTKPREAILILRNDFAGELKLQICEIGNDMVSQIELVDVSDGTHFSGDELTIDLQKDEVCRLQLTFRSPVLGGLKAIPHEVTA